MATAEPAVIVRQAYKYYGKKNDPKKKIVLNYLNMIVEKGTIYGLLGSSGCGKTTLLSCVVGRRSLVTGQIRVLGGDTSPQKAKRIGYMPQEVALVGEFSVKDAIFFFGRIYGMSESNILSRFHMLSDLLELPDENRLVKNLSGGQQRRVSFAAAMVHEPELLILDEPTVGLDPLLRDKIWNFLVDLSVNNGVAVIITTHYIEEARQAHRIGLMRGGELLAEQPPQTLMARFNCQTLEEAFLILSIKQSKADGGTEEPVILEHHETPIDGAPDPESGEVKEQYDSTEDFNKFYNLGSSEILTNTSNSNDTETTKVRLTSKNYIFKALFIKNIQQFSRHPGGLVFSIIFPIIQMLAFLLSVGHDPRVINIAVVNDEVPIWSDCFNTSLVTAEYNSSDYTCHLNKLSCRYVRSLDEEIITKTFYSTIEEAFLAVEKGHAMGALYIASNFSESWYQRLEVGERSVDGVIENSAANYWLDMSNHQIAHFVKKKLYKDYENFSKDLMKECQASTKLASIPVNFQDPIYGTKNTTYTDFMAPGLMATILFFLATTATSNLMISDRLEGVWDRIIVAGVHSSQILTVHVVIQSMIIILQTVEVMTVAFIGYQVPFHGDITTVGVLLILQGFVGMCYGLFVSVMCNSYSVSFFVSTGSFYPMILLCGIVWPIEGMTKGLKIISLFLPFTIPIQSLRNVIEKGYTITNFNVFDGYLVSLGWLTFLLGMCYLSLRIHK